MEENIIQISRNLVNINEENKRGIMEYYKKIAVLKEDLSKTLKVATDNLGSKI